MLIDHLRQSITDMPMHMPGHKRNLRLFPFLKELGGCLDITEIEGMDNLHAPKGIIKQTMELASSLWNAPTLLGINGSTGCLHAAILALVNTGDMVLVARNSHISVYNALRLVKARMIILDVGVEPKTGVVGSIQTEQVLKSFQENPEIKLVIITSPTYEGVVSDIQSISDTVHQFGAKLLVDEAHGAHLGICSFGINNALQEGADIVVHSLHKTLPALTQTALLHVNEPSLFEAVSEKMDMLQTTSPSYLLLASIDACVRLLLKDGERLFKVWQQELQIFYREVQSLKNIKVPFLDCSPYFYAIDSSKISIGGRLNGKIGMLLTRKLRKQKVEPEMTTARYTVCLSSIGDERDTFERLHNTLIEIDNELNGLSHDLAENGFPSLPSMTSVQLIEESVAKVLVPIQQACGRLCAETVYVYPPGIPLLIPGAIISKQIIEYIEQADNQGLQVVYSKEPPVGKMHVFDK